MIFFLHTGHLCNKCTFHKSLKKFLVCHIMPAISTFPHKHVSLSGAKTSPNPLRAKPARHCPPTAIPNNASRDFASAKPSAHSWGIQLADCECRWRRKYLSLNTRWNRLTVNSPVVIHFILLGPYSRSRWSWASTVNNQFNCIWKHNQNAYSRQL